METITASELASRTDLPDWRVLLDGIEAHFRAGSFTGAATFAARIAALADEWDHHPDLDVRYPDRVHVTLTSHDVGGLTSRDVDLALRISAMASESGVAAEPQTSTRAEVGIDAMDIDAVRPFWKAALGYQEVPPATGTGPAIVLVDPLRVGPPVWFQQMDAPRTERNRLHVDITVPHDVAEQRVADTIAAGGRLVTDQYARAFWVLADPEGNEACICTWQDRT